MNPPTTPKPSESSTTPESSTPFQRATEHIWIGSIDSGHPDDGELTVKAQYNPATLEITQSMAWKKPEAGNQGGGTAPASSASKPDENFMAQEFTGSEGRSISIELLFDGYENGGKLEKDGPTVAQMVGRLESLASVQDPKSSDEKKRRPHHCAVVWPGALARFTCVIESLTTKYTMFSTKGVPLRATCTVKLKEAVSADKKKTDKKPAKKKAT